MVGQNQRMKGATSRFDHKKQFDQKQVDKKPEAKPEKQEKDKGVPHHNAPSFHQRDSRNQLQGHGDMHGHNHGHGGDDAEVPAGPKKFTGRCRLFVGNLPNDTTEEQFKQLFASFGELSEVFINSARGFGFVRLDTRQNAEAAKAALDGMAKRNRVLRVRFATHGAALRIKFLPTHVSNELLEEAFSQFGVVERSIVIVDDRGKPTGEGIVEFARKPGAQQALTKINDGAFLLGASPRPVLVEPLEQKDEDDGYPEKFIMKNAGFHKEREQGPRFAPPGSFEYEMAQKWKEVYRMEADHKMQLQREMEQAIARLELEQEQALHEHQAMLLRQDLMRRQEELRKLEERQMEMAKRMEMRMQEEDMRRQEEERRRQEIMMRQQQEQEMRRRQMEGNRRPNIGGPNEDFDMRGGGRNMENRGRPNNFNEIRGGRSMENRGGRGVEFNESGEMRGEMRRGSDMRGERGGAPPMQPPPAPPAALGLDRSQRSQGMGNQGQGGMGGGAGMGGQNNMGSANQRQSRFDQPPSGGGGGGSSSSGGFGNNSMGPGSNMGQGGNNMANNSGSGGPGNMMGGNAMGSNSTNLGRGPMGNERGMGMNRRREGGPREEYFENKRPRF